MDHSDMAQSEWFQDLLEFFKDTPVQLGARLAQDNAQTPGKVQVLFLPVVGATFSSNS